MKHPKNKRDRFITGTYKAVKRTKSITTKTSTEQFVEKTLCRTRHTTISCSCYICGNPRKFFNEKTMQKKRIESSELNNE